MFVFHFLMHMLNNLMLRNNNKRFYKKKEKKNLRSGINLNLIFNFKTTNLKFYKAIVSFLATVQNIQNFQRRFSLLNDFKALVFFFFLSFFFKMFFSQVVGLTEPL